MNIKQLFYILGLWAGLSACQNKVEQAALQVFSSQGYDSCRQIFKDNAGKLYVWGEWNLGDIQETSLRLIQWDPANKKVAWAAQWLKAEVPHAIGVAQLSDGNLVCVGDTGRPFPNAVRKIYLGIFDQQGNLQAENELKWPHPVFKGTKMALTPQGNVVLALHDAGGLAGKWLIITADKFGNVNSNPIQTPAFPADLERYHCHVSDIKVEANGDIYVISTLHGTDKKTKLDVHLGWICRFNAQGTLLGSKTILKGLACRPSSLLFVNNKVVVTGAVANPSSQIDDIFCIAYTKDLDSLSFSTSGGIREEGLFRDKLLVQSMAEGDDAVMTVALSKSYNLGNPLILITKFSIQGGNPLSEGTIGGYLGEFSPAGIQKTEQGFYWVAGTSNAWFSGKYNSDWVLFRTDALGNLSDP